MITTMLPATGTPLHFLITGATGMIGRALVARLHNDGHQLTLLSRHPDPAGTRVWDPTRGNLDLTGLPPIDAAIHLAGENVGGGRWNTRRKQAILESRVNGTRLLASTLAELSPRPSALICASAVGAYAANGELHNESSPTSRDSFLGQVTSAWEAAADPARLARIRVTHIRLGVVLGREGGALAKLLPLFRLGLGGKIGNGRMGFPWIALADAAALFHQAAINPAYTGIINGVAPEYHDNRSFTKALSGTLHRPAIFPVPAIAIRAIFGQMGIETVLADHRIQSTRLASLAFPFTHPTLATALADACGMASSTR